MQTMLVTKEHDKRGMSGGHRVSNDIVDRTVVIETDDGAMRAFVAQPAASGRHSAVVMVQHIGGLSETMKIMARRTARLGLLCIVPALYHRLGDIVLDPVNPEPSISAIRSIAVASLTPAQVRADIGATLGWLQNSPDVQSGPYAIMGFGGGAGQALRLAVDFPGQFRALISILGVGFVRPGDPDSPHLRLGEISGGAYFGFAGEDEIIPASAVEELRQVMAASGVEHEITVHPGVRHGYAFPDRAVYSEAAAEDDWTRIGRMLARHLPGPDTQNWKEPS